MSGSVGWDGQVLGTVSTFQCFGTSPLKMGGIQKKLLKYLEKISCHQIIPEKHKSLQCAGPWPGLTELCSTEFSAHCREGKSLGLRAK